MATLDTNATRQRYDRIAPFYDRLQRCMEQTRVNDWRRALWAQVAGPQILEVGVGTGKNLPYYPTGATITAIDFSPRMLEQARQRATAAGRVVDLRLMDVEALDFPDGTFDSVVGSFVFCSVPNPVQGLRELRRVVKPGGRIALLEHVRPPGFAGRVADRLNPLVVRIAGANINRRTLDNVRAAGLELTGVANLGGELVKLLCCTPPAARLAHHAPPESRAVTGAAAPLREHAAELVGSPR